MIKADCPNCHQPLAVTEEQPSGSFRYVRRVSGYGRRADTRMLYGACAACSLLLEDVIAHQEVEEEHRADIADAIAGARRARAIFDNGRGDNRVAMTELARAFHGLRRVEPPGVSPWDSDKLLGWVQSGEGNRHIINAARFVLHVWNDRDMAEALGGPFDSMDAIAGWDRIHRAAYAEWVRDPWWP